MILMIHVHFPKKCIRQLHKAKVIDLDWREGSSKSTDQERTIVIDEIMVMSLQALLSSSCS